ncbi:MFS transporter [Sphingobium sp. MK2]|uniref:MFS transporter n=1 Tax=Sphingobium sp. MK2 TaxID=3116540 RepID=UPI0032E36792
MVRKTGLSAYAAFSVLIMAMAWNFEGAAINPALATLREAFPQEPLYKVLFVSTAPFVTSTIFSGLCGWLAGWFDKKHIALGGLLIYGVSGIAPAYMTSLDAILAARIVTGVGVGLVLPISAMLIAEHYAGRDKDRMNGLMLAVFNIANIVVSIAVGLLVDRGWQVAFLAFGFIFLLLVNTAIGCPSSPPVRDATKRHRSAPAALPPIAFAMFALMALLWLAFAYLLLSLATFNASRAIVPMAAIGGVIAVPGAANAVAALLYPLLGGRIRFLPSVALIMLACGFALAAQSHAPVTLLAACVLVGLGQGVLVPFVLSVTGGISSVAARDRSLGLVQSAVHLGALAATFVFPAVFARATTDPYSFAYNAAAAASVAAAACSLCLVIFASRRERFQRS